MKFQQRLRLLTRRVTLNRLSDGIKEVPIKKWFGQKLHRAGFHRSDRHGNVAMASHENDGDVDACGIEFALQVQSAQSGQTHIENEAGSCLWTLAFQKLCRRLKIFDLKSAKPNQTLGRSAKRRIVLDQRYDLAPFEARLFFASLAGSAQ
jgi:hypothetical protein